MSKPLLKKILYVEDEPDITAIAQIALEDIGGFSVYYCSSGYEALNSLDNYQPDLILLDIMMPGMDGPKTLHKIRQSPLHANIPIIFMTAKIQSHEIVQYRAVGAIDVIPKPFDPMTLAEHLRQVWQNISDK